MRWRAPVVKGKQVRLLTREPRVTFFDLPESGLRSELIGNDEVRIVDGKGTTVAQRMNPSATFRGLARLTWDALDFTYFAGDALWNYLTTPFLLVYKDVHVTHMRVRANLTEAETKALLQYLQDNAPAKPAARQH